MNTKIASTIIGAVAALGVAVPAVSDNGPVIAIHAQTSGIIGNGSYFLPIDGLGLWYKLASNPTQWLYNEDTPLAGPLLTAAKATGAIGGASCPNDPCSLNVYVAYDTTTLNTTLMNLYRPAYTNVANYVYGVSVFNRFDKAFVSIGRDVSALMSSADQVTVAVSALRENKPVKYRTGTNTYIFNASTNKMEICGACLVWIEML